MKADPSLTDDVTQFMTIRVTPDDYWAIRRIAVDMRVKPSMWARRVLERELERLGVDRSHGVGQSDFITCRSNDSAASSSEAA